MHVDAADSGCFCAQGLLSLSKACLLRSLWATLHGSPATACLTLWLLAVHAHARAWLADHQLVHVQVKECGVWQHCECVHYDAAAGGAFLCPECRFARADPFWRPTNRSLAAPARLVHAPGRPQRAGGSWDEWYSHLRRDFQLPHALLEGLRSSADTQLQARACVLEHHLNPSPNQKQSLTP